MFKGDLIMKIAGSLVFLLSIWGVILLIIRDGEIIHGPSVVIGILIMTACFGLGVALNYKKKG